MSRTHETSAIHYVVLWQRLSELRQSEKEVYDEFLALIQFPQQRQPSSGARLRELELVSGNEGEWKCCPTDRHAIILLLALEECFGPTWSDNAVLWAVWQMFIEDVETYRSLKYCASDPNHTPQSLKGHPFIEYEQNGVPVMRGELRRVMRVVVRFDRAQEP